MRMWFAIVLAFVTLIVAGAPAKGQVGSGNRIDYEVLGTSFNPTGPAYAMDGERGIWTIAWTVPAASFVVNANFYFSLNLAVESWNTRRCASEVSLSPKMISDSLSAVFTGGQPKFLAPPPKTIGPVVVKVTIDAIPTGATLLTGHFKADPPAGCGMGEGPGVLILIQKSAAPNVTINSYVSAFPSPGTARSSMDVTLFTSGTNTGKVQSTDPEKVAYNVIVDTDTALSSGCVSVTIPSPLAQTAPGGRFAIAASGSGTPATFDDAPSNAPCSAGQFGPFDIPANNMLFLNVAADIPRMSANPFDSASSLIVTFSAVASFSEIVGLNTSYNLNLIKK